MNKNILGEDLQKCGPSTGDAATGYTRNGYCTHTKGDRGRHFVCVTRGKTNEDHQAWEKFLDFTDGTSNKSLSEFLRRTKADSWCLCEGRYNQALENNSAPRIKPAATNSLVSGSTASRILKSLNKMSVCIENLYQLLG